jgi:hypothetical protein
MVEAVVAVVAEVAVERMDMVERLGLSGRCCTAVAILAVAV